MATRRVNRRRPKPRASTSDVVGPNQRTAPAPRKWRKHYARLLELRDEVLRSQAVLFKDASEEQPAFSSHIADAGTDSYDRDFALGMLSAEHDAILEIDQALDRIHRGAYGRCELTGKPIEAARLEAIPWTRFSAAAERQLELEAGGNPSRLGPRETVVKPRRGPPAA
jgi:RNA polymerase-binding transcription factor DksA